MQAKTLKTPVMTRQFELDRAGIDESKRTVALSFSSETPVERWFGVEILDHNPSSVDLSRLNAGGALLMDHSTRDQIGVVESSTIDTDKKGRAVVRFGKSARAEEIFQDVKDGIRRLVSVGYRIDKMVTEKVEKGLETLRAVAWTPLEISLVSVPADPNVGVGRSEEKSQFETVIEPLKGNRNMETSTVTATSPAPAPAPTPGLRIGNEYNAAFSEIEAIGEALKKRGVQGIDALQSRAICDKMDVETFRKEAFKLLPKLEPVRAAEPLDVKPKEWARYSIARAIVGKLNGKLEGFEAEMNQECALKHGRQADGFWVPDEVMSRNAVVGTGTLGGMLVQTDNLASQFIEVLRNKSQVLNLGARVLNLSRQCTIPRQSGALTANWVGETVASTLSGVQLQQLTLTPQAISANVQYAKMLLMESDPSIDSILRDDIAAQLAIAIDLAALHGTGSGQPTGIIATTGIGSVLLATDGLAINNTTAYPAMVSLESVVATANADQGALAYLMRPTIRGALKTTVRFASTNTPVWEKGEVNGYRAEVTNQVSKLLTTGTATTISTPVFFGNWNELIVANFGSTDLVVDPYTAGANGVVRLYARRWVDIGLRHPASFAVLGGVLNG